MRVRPWSATELVVQSLPGCDEEWRTGPTTLTPSGSAATAINTGRRMGLFWIPQRSTIFCGILSAMDLGCVPLCGDKVLNLYAHSISIFPVRFNGHIPGGGFLICAGTRTQNVYNNGRRRTGDAIITWEDWRDELTIYPTDFMLSGLIALAHS